jgi:peptidase C25-like protein/CARDB protein
MKNSLLFIYLIFLVSITVAHAESYNLNVLKQSSTEIIFEVQFEKPIENQTISKEQNSTIIQIPGLLISDKMGDYTIPFLSKQFSLAGEDLHSEILNIETNTFESSNNPQKINSQNRNTTNTFKNYNVELNGIFRDVPIYNVNIFPVKINDTKVTWIKNIKLRIWVDKSNSKFDYVFDKKNKNEKNILENMLLNGKSITYKKSIPLTLEKTTQKYVSGKYKILVKEDGLYQVTYQDLIDAGMDLNSINPKNLKLSNKGQEIAIYFKGSGDLTFDSGDYFEFWGEKNINTFLNEYPDMYVDPFSNINVYWLEQASSSGLRMVEESGALIISNPAQYVVPIFYNEKIHFERDSHFEHFGQAGASLDLPSYTLDNWYYDSGIIADGNYSYDFFLPYPYSQGSFSVFVKAAMRGRSYRDYVKGQNTNMTSHEAELRINEGTTGNKIGESGNWPDQEMHVIQNTTGLSQSFVYHGINALKVNMTQEDNTISDIVLLNWFEVEYRRKYRAHNNSIVFRKQDGISTGFMFQFEVDGFTNPNIELYKKGVSKIVNHRIDYYTDPDNLKSYRISFQDSIFYSGIEYVALTKDQKKKPFGIEKDNPWIPDAITDVSLLDNINSSDYLIITHDLLYDNVLLLNQFHEQNGLNTSTVKVQDIYDEFNYGIKSPLAIKEFITYVYNNWDQTHPLYYVNLVGSASENYKTTSQSKPDLVPTLLFQTKKYGASAADFQYSLISGGDNDVVPDLIVGRIPAKNNSEFLNYMDKLTNYTSNSDVGLWTNTALMISGNDATTKELDIYPHAFRGQNQRILNFKVPDEFFMRKINTIRDTTLINDSNFGGTTDLINYWDDGISYINFFGHGGGGIWADLNLFNTDDIDRLNNGYKLPFISSMTCYTGAFENKSLSTLANKLITVANKGAIAVYASSGLGWLHNDFALGWSLTENLFEKRLSIGESILLSKIFYLSNAVYFYDDKIENLSGFGGRDFEGLHKSMVNQYNLLGEPNVYLPSPENDLQISVDQNLLSVGDTINVEINSQFVTGEIYVELTNENNEPLIENFDAIQSTGNNFTFTIPEELNEQVGYIKAFATNSSQNASGFTQIAVKKSLLDSVTVTPQNPLIGDPVNLFVHIHSETPLETIAIRNLSRLNKHQPDIILTRLSDTLYTTSTSLGPYNNEGTWYFTVEIEDTLGNIATYHQQSFTVIDPRPDLEIVNDSFEFTGKTDIQISLQVKNNFTENISGINIGFFVDEYNSNSTPFHFVNESFLANSKKEISFTVDNSLLSTGKKFIAVIDYDSLLTEKDESNNVDSSLVYESFILVTAANGTIDTLDIHNIAKVFIEPNALSQSSTMNFSINDDSNRLRLDSQPGFNYIPFGFSNDSISLNLKLNNNEAQLIAQAFVAFKIDTSLSVDSLNHIGIYRFSSHLNQWVKVPGDILYNGYKFVKTHTLGEFALFYVSDTQNPVIEISVNGRELRNNMLVPSMPELAVILQDENGIDISKGIYIKIDSDTIPRSEMNVPDSIRVSNAISILTSPHFQTGEHTLTVEALDANGNKTVKLLNFTTSGNFDVVIYGNYPNPFTEDTHISYFIDSGGLLDEFSIKIYTVSGRMIRKLNTSDQRYREPDYNEVKWDSRDDDGNYVANGVYFAIVKAKYDGKEVEHRLKLAKLK